jgi:hypothetical protein
MGGPRNGFCVTCHHQTDTPHRQVTNAIDDIWNLFVQSVISTLHQCSNRTYCTLLEPY